jgi:hypothetical protein
LVKGRHWPIIDRVLMGDGSGKIRKAYNLGGGSRPFIHRRVGRYQRRWIT